MKHNGMPVQFKLLMPDATPPAYQTEGAAAVDFHAYIPGWESGNGRYSWLEPGKTLKVSTGISVYIGNPRYALIVLPRSGLGTRGIVLAHGLGLVDSDDQGELTIPLFNRGDESFKINHGDRIAQGVFLPVEQVSFVQVPEFSQRTSRGEGGFGSTGVASGFASGGPLPDRGPDRGPYLMGSA